MPHSTASIVSGALGDFARTWPKLLAADVVYKLTAFVLLIPLVGLALRSGLALSGESILTDQDILFFVLTPLGILTLVVVAGATLAVVALEQAALMVIGFRSLRGARVSVSEALILVGRHVGSIVALAIRLVGRVLLLLLPFLALAGLAYRLLLTEYDINFYLQNRPPAFYVAAALLGAILLALAWCLVPRLIDWTYALPLHLFETVPARRALAESAVRTKESRSTIATVLVVWALLSLFLSTAGLVLVGGLARALLPRVRDSMSLLLFTMGGLLLLWILVNLLLTLFQASGFALLVVRLYERSGIANAAEVPAEGGEEPGAGARRAIGWKPALAALIAAAVAAGVLGLYLVKSVRTDDDVLVIAHRGAAGRAPENTMASFGAAMDDGADLVELDVQETKDGVVVVIHDSDFMRIARKNVRVWEGSLDKLRAFDIGSWFSSKFASERLPTLEEVLALAQGRGARLDIELKFYGHDERLEERVVELVEASGMASNVVIMSLSPKMVQKVRALRPGWTVGLLTATAVGDLTRTDADFLAVHVAMASPSFIRRAHSAGKAVYVWTVNDPINMSTMMSRGVDGIITDEPALAREVIARRAALSSVERLLLEASSWLGAGRKEPPAEADVH